MSINAKTRKIPNQNQSNTNFFFYRLLSLIILFLIFGAVYYFTVYNKKEVEKKEYNYMEFDEDWYYVELSNDESFYGFITTVTDDFIELDNVYYDYSIIEDENEKGEKELRIVKRGSEKHEPSGDMFILKNQIIFLEKLAIDSKIRSVIKEYESQY